MRCSLWFSFTQYLVYCEKHVKGNEMVIFSRSVKKEYCASFRLPTFPHGVSTPAREDNEVARIILRGMMRISNNEQLYLQQSVMFYFPVSSLRSSAISCDLPSVNILLSIKISSK